MGGFVHRGGFVHDAVVYGSEAEFLASLLPFIQGDLNHREPLIAVTVGSHRALLAEALGPAAEGVHFIDAATWFRRPAATIAAYHRLFCNLLDRGASRLRVVDEVQFGSTPGSHKMWTSYEAILNRAFADMPVWIVCPYDLRACPETVITGATQTHPHVLSASGRQASADYQEPESVVRALEPAFEMPSQRADLELSLGTELYAIRCAVGDFAVAAGLERDQAELFTLACHEVVSNALVHGGGAGSIRLWRLGDRLLCVVTDGGPGLDDVCAGFIPPPVQQTGGVCGSSARCATASTWAGRRRAASRSPSPATPSRPPGPPTDTLPRPAAGGGGHARPAATVWEAGRIAHPADQGGSMADYGRVAVITGGASGIGFATADLLGQQGWRLVLADIEGGRLDAAVGQLAGRTETVGVVTDVAKLDDVEALAEQTYTRFGRADVVFNNAGVAVGGPVAAMSHADWEWIIAVDLWGPIHGVEAFLPRMRAAGTGGHLLFTASFAGLVPNIGLGPYCVAKYGVVALAEVLHRELRLDGIGVSVLCPMRVATDIGDSARNRPPELGGPVSAAPVADQSEANTAMAGRVLPVEVVAQEVVAAIGTDRLYVVPHEESRAMIQRRFERIDRAFER